MGKWRPTTVIRCTARHTAVIAERTGGEGAENAQFWCAPARRVRASARMHLISVRGVTLRCSYRYIWTRIRAFESALIAFACPILISGSGTLLFNATGKGMARCMVCASLRWRPLCLLVRRFYASSVPLDLDLLQLLSLDEVYVP